MSYAGENELPSQWADSVRPSLIPSQLYLLDTLQGEKGCEAENECFVISGPLPPTRWLKSAIRGDSAREGSVMSFDTGAFSQIPPLSRGHP